MSNSLITSIKDLAISPASDKGFDVVGVELVPKAIPMIIQIQIQHLGGEEIKLSDCELLSTPIAEAIEDSKLIEKPYVLEISSPGIKESLKTEKDFETFKGFPIEVIFQDEKNTRVKQKGLLHAKSNDFLKINLKGRITKIPLKDVMKVRLTTPSG